MQADQAAGDTRRTELLLQVEFYKSLPICHDIKLPRSFKVQPPSMSWTCRQYAASMSVYIPLSMLYVHIAWPRCHYLVEGRHCYTNEHC